VKSLPSCEGSPLTVKTTRAGTIFVAKGHVIRADEHCANGTLHEVDTLLMPPQLVLVAAAASPAPDASTNAAPADAASATDTNAAPATNNAPDPRPRRRPFRRLRRRDRRCSRRFCKNDSREHRLQLVAGACSGMTDINFPRCRARSFARRSMATG
jgi:hypothetical protein